MNATLYVLLYIYIHIYRDKILWDFKIYMRKLYLIVVDSFYDLTKETFARLTNITACDQFLSRTKIFILVALSDCLHL